MENLKIGQKVRIKSKDWYEAYKCLGLELPEDKNIFDMCHIGQIGNIESICGDLVLVKFYDGYSGLFHKCWLEPIENKVTIQKDMETNKLILNGITLPKGTEAKVSVEEGATIITFQKQEIESKEPKFKDGDILLLTNNDGFEYIVIFKEMDKDIIYVHALMNITNNRIGENEELLRDKISNVRKADFDEQERMFKELANQKQLRWNAEELKFEEYRWRAEKGGKFWFITSNGVVDYAIDNYKPIGDLCFNSRNYFQTEELANKALPLWKEFFKNLNVR